MKNFLKETLQFALIALFVVLPIRYFIAQPFIVSGESMVPTFHDGDYLIIDQISYRFNEPERGDVIIMRYPLDTKKYFIKRIIGLPSETVSIENGIVTIIGAEGEQTLSEPYIEFQSNSTTKKVLASDEYFVMGDNRAGSSDSRVWGPLPAKNIIGKALIRLLPINDIKLHPGLVNPTE